MSNSVLKESRVERQDKHQENGIQQSSSKQGLLQKYLSREISIDYKACAYFFCLFLFYCAYLLLQGIYAARILHLVEIFVSTYIISYLQVYLFWNFDEAEQIGIREAVGMLLSTILYTLASYFCGWFGKSLLVSVWFVVYLVFIFLSLFATNLIKRRIDTKELNQMLKGFKEGRG